MAESGGFIFETSIVSFTDNSNSWFQSAIDAVTLVLMHEFNSLGAKKSRGQVQLLVYGTFQAHLRDVHYHCSDVW